MNRNELYWVLGILVAIAAIIWIASYATSVTPSASTTVATTSMPSASGALSSAGSGSGNIGGITNPGASTSSAPYQTELLQLGTTLTNNGVKATPLAIVEDSRCPVGVQCIQAGTVRVNVKFSFNGLSTTRIFTLGVPQSAYGYTAELKSVIPSKKEGVTISPNDYRFVFVIAKP